MATSGHDYRPLVESRSEMERSLDQIACVLTLPSSSSRPSARSCSKARISVAISSD
jgi:hypothetical protein